MIFTIFVQNVVLGIILHSRDFCGNSATGKIRAITLNLMVTIYIIHFFVNFLSLQNTGLGFIRLTRITDDAKFNSGSHFVNEVDL